MTPQLQQAIRLLALSNLEIEGFIAEELERNPLLDAGSEEAPPLETVETPEREAGGEADEAPTVDRLVAEGDAQADAPLDLDYNDENIHQDSPSDSIGGMDGGLGLDAASRGSGEGLEYDSVASAQPSLAEYLLSQAGTSLSGADQ